MKPSRRRFLTIAAAAIAAPSVALARQTAHWQGRAMGAPASMELAGVSSSAAQPIFAALEAEIDRLERIFSLYHPESTLVQLNRTGRLDAPPSELLDVMTLADRLYSATEGAFDPTVQPLVIARESGRSKRAARTLVGWHKLRFDARTIQFDRPGMAITLNGIAQGYVTDRIAALLRAQGLTDVLVDIGEIAAIGRNWKGHSWQAAIARQDGQVERHVTLRNRALATTIPMDKVLSDGHGHIMCRDGRGPCHNLVSVSAPSAALADGLSTALVLLRPEAVLRATEQFPGARIELII